MISDKEYRQQLYARTASLYRDYSPAGSTTGAKRRARARKAGIASGVARRRRSTCKRPPRPRTRQQALALAYRIRQVDRPEFERRYRALCDAQELRCDIRGLHTAYALYVRLVRAYRVQGQDWETTNKQLERAMELAGRGRARSTIQRTRKRLFAMELIAFEHVRRSGFRRIPGQMDSLRCRCLCPKAKAHLKYDTPPSGAGAAALRPTAAPAQSTATTLIPPPTAADDIGPAAPAESIERTGPEARLWFVQLKLDIGWSTAELELERDQLLRQLAGQEIDRTLRNRSEGFR